MLEDAKKRLGELTTQRDTLDRELQGVLRIIEGAQKGAQIGTQPTEPITLPDPPAILM